MLPSPAFAPLRAGLVEVAMQPEHASATAITRTNDLIRIPPMRQYRPQFLTVYESRREERSASALTSEQVRAATLALRFG
jgi:hypothetical protein